MKFRLGEFAGEFTQSKLPPCASRRSTREINSESRNFYALKANAQSGSVIMKHSKRIEKHKQTFKSDFQTVGHIIFNLLNEELN